MIVADGKKIVPVYGNMRPVEVRKNHKRMAGWVEESKSGESVEFENTYNHFADVLVSGKSEQVQTVQGKNLLDADVFVSEALSLSLSDGAIISLVDEDGINCLKVRANRSTRFVPLDLNINYKPETRYSFRANMKATSTVGWSACLYVFYTDGSLSAFARPYSTGGTWGVETLITTTGKTIDYISLGCANNNNDIYATFFDLSSLQIEEGSVATAYEPFVPDSPSPDYPSPVNSAGDCNLVSRGKNLFDAPRKIEDFVRTLNPVSVIDNGDFVALEGTSNYTYYATKDIPIKPDTYYTFSVDGYGDADIYKKLEIKVRNNDDSTATISSVTLGTSRSIKNTTFKTPVSAAYLYINYYVTVNNASGSMYVYSAQLEEGSVATGYEPYHRTEAPLPVLRKIGDVADTYNPKTGEYVQRIGVKVFDGTEELRKTSNPPHINTTNNMINTCINLPGLNPSFLGFSTHNKHIYTSQLVEGINRINNYIWITLSFDRLGYTSGDDARPLVNAWLAAQYAAGTPVTVYYQLAEPIVTYLDPATVPTYYPFTRLEQDGAVKGTIDATVKVME